MYSAFEKWIWCVWGKIHWHQLWGLCHWFQGATRMVILLSRTQVKNFGQVNLHVYSKGLVGFKKNWNSVRQDTFKMCSKKWILKWVVQRTNGFEKFCHILISRAKILCLSFSAGMARVFALAGGRFYLLETPNEQVSFTVISPDSKPS